MQKTVTFLHLSPIYSNSELIPQLFITLHLQYYSLNNSQLLHFSQ